MQPERHVPGKWPLSPGWGLVTNEPPYKGALPLCHHFLPCSPDEDVPPGSPSRVVGTVPGTLCSWVCSAVRG